MEPIRKRGRNTARRKMEQRLLIGFEICENWHSSISKVLDQEFSRPKSAKSMKSGAFHKHFIRSKYPHVRRMAIAALWGYERQHQIEQARTGSAVNQLGRAHVELQSLMPISYAVFCFKK